MEDYSFLLNERIKEQKCLHEVIGLVRGGGKKDTILQSITDLLPEGFLYPEYCQVSLRVSDRAEPYLSKDYRDPDHREHYDIIVGGGFYTAVLNSGIAPKMRVKQLSCLKSDRCSARSVP